MKPPDGFPDALVGDHRRRARSGDRDVRRTFCPSSGTRLSMTFTLCTKKWCGREIQSDGEEGGHDPEDDAGGVRFNCSQAR